MTDESLNKPVEPYGLDDFLKSAKSLFRIWPLVIAIAITLATLPFLSQFESITACVIATKIIQFVSVYAIAMATSKLWRARKANEIPVEPIRLFLIFMAIHVAVLLVIYPGGWRWDDVIQFTNTMQTGVWTTWQHYLTTLFYMLCMVTIPIPAFVAFVQVAIISAVLSFITWKLHTYFKSPPIVVLILLIQFLPPVLNIDFQPLRNAPCAYLELLAFFFLAMHVIEKRRWTFPELIRYALLVALVSTWRTECIILLAIVPFLLLVCEWKRLTAAYLISFFVILCVCFGAFSWYQNTYNSKEYTLTAYMPSLPLFAHQALEDNNEELLEELRATYDVEVLNAAYEAGVSGEKIYYSLGKWPFCIVPNDERDDAFYTQCRNSFIKGTLAYPKLYLKSRIDQFVDYQEVIGYFTPCLTKDLFNGDNSYLEPFINSNYLFNEPISMRARNLACSYMETLPPKFDFLTFTYNLFLIMPIYVIALIVFAFRKPKIALLIAAYCVHPVVTFLSAPAYYFMYYYSFYLGGLLLFVILISMLVQLISERVTKAKTAVETS